jgi:hypothetical protein
MKFVFLALCVVAAAADPHWVVLDQTEVGLVKSSWDQVKHSEVDILYYVFKEHPDIMAKFPAFVGKDLETLKDTGKFALHATRIVSFFSEYINLLGTNGGQPAIKTILNEMGYNHKNRGIPKEQFNEFRGSLFGYLKAHVSWGDNVEHAWNDAFDKMYFVIFSNLDGQAVQ